MNEYWLFDGGLIVMEGVWDRMEKGQHQDLGEYILLDSYVSIFSLQCTYCHFL